MNDYKLRPCPFCGAEEIGIKMEGFFQPWKGDGIKMWFKAYCYCCGVETDYMANTTMQKAIDHWNDRGDKR